MKAASLGLAGVVLALAALGGCSRSAGPAGASVAEVRTAAHAAARGTSVPSTPAPARHDFSNLPDRGELLDYPGNIVRHDGAYTWHRADLSETHALNAIASGHLRLITPSGEPLDVQYDQHVEHPSGDWTWIGHVAGHPGDQTILTFGEHAAYGSIAQPGKPPLRLTVRKGSSWLVETDPARIAGIDNAATHPTRPDYHVPPRSGSPDAAEAGGAPTKASAPVMASATASTTTTVDLVLGYTPAFATDHGGKSGAVTRLNYLVDVANAAYANSQVAARVRLVATVEVSYPDNTSNDTALDQLTGYDSSTNSKTAPDAAFSALRSARDQYGADLVSLVRSFREPENGGCGIGWLIGGGQSGISGSDAYYGYSVVGDGTDAGTDGKTYFCLDETLAHEMGHNMGAQHDVDAAKGTDGKLDASDYGAYAYSFGYKNSTDGFYTVMAYGDPGQHIYRIFSDPRSTFCGGKACGTSQADNAKTLTQTIPVVATFRATVVASVSSFVAHDFNGDGNSDILWRNQQSGANTLWRSASSAARQTVSAVTNLNWQVAGTGDFNGDGVADILWRNAATGENVVWRSASAASTQAVSPVSNANWTVAGIGDFDGDGTSDIFWRNAATGDNVIWRSADSATQQAVTAVGDTRWKVVGIGDFNADGVSDVLWRNAPTGSNAIWLSANAATGQAVASVTDAHWSVVGVGDFNGDGSADILWRNSASGANAIWKSGNYATSQSVASVTNQAWKVAEIGDFNGDGKADILWRNLATGADAIWLSANVSAPKAVDAVGDFSWTVIAG